MRKRPAISLVILILGLLLPGAENLAQAQYYGDRPAPPPPPPGYIPRPEHNPFGYKHRTHFYLQAELTGLAILGQQIEGVGRLSHGAGFGLGMGVRLGRWVGIEANYTFTSHDAEIWSEEGYTFWDINSHNIQTVTADLKLHIPTRSRVEPFFQLGGGWSFFGLAGMDPYYESKGYSYLYASGPTFSLGGGGQVWFGPHFTLGGRLLYRGMYFGESAYALEARDSKGNTQSFLANSNYISALALDIFLGVHF